MKNILVIRRDNIGDLVCTTPLIEGIKTAWPEANVYLLINTVSQDVVKNNPHITRTFIYRKAKHAAGKLASWQAGKLASWLNWAYTPTG